MRTHLGKKKWVLIALNYQILFFRSTNWFEKIVISQSLVAILVYLSRHAGTGVCPGGRGFNHFLLRRLFCPNLSLDCYVVDKVFQLRKEQDSLPAE